MRSVTAELSGWGRYPVVRSSLFRPEKISDLPYLLGTKAQCIGRGQGRSYGDASLCSEGATINFMHLNRFRDFDARNGTIECEAGVRLDEILKMTVPRGWFLPVVPGTRFPSIGGCLACDVHGKNHHRDGSLSNHVLSCQLLLANGKTVTCSRTENPDLFWATAGGMGLTGLIQTVSLQLTPIETAYIEQTTQRTNDLEHTLALLAETNRTHSYTVAWMDTVSRGAKLGRGVVFAGNAASNDILPGKLRETPLTVSPKLQYTIPLDLPSWFVNQASIRAFNSLYFHNAPETPRKTITDYETFFFPLDAILHWNRLYGKRGLLQYQCVLPLSKCEESVREILERIMAMHTGSFLSVLKIMGSQEGLLSFPMEGVTLAMDFANRPGIASLLDNLDRIVVKRGGHIYLAKDARLTKEMFVEMQPNLNGWLAIKQETDPENVFSSSLSRRIGLT